jgi:hypothetical protein
MPWRTWGGAIIGAIEELLCKTSRHTHRFTAHA